MRTTAAAIAATESRNERALSRMGADASRCAGRRQGAGTVMSTPRPSVMHTARNGRRASGAAARSQARESGVWATFCAEDPPLFFLMKNELSRARPHERTFPEPPDRIEVDVTSVIEH